MKAGLVISIALAILAFNWTTEEYENSNLQIDDILDGTIEVEAIRTAQSQPREMPPPVVSPSDEIIPVETVEYSDAPEVIESPDTFLSPPPPPPCGGPYPPAPAPWEEEIFKVVEEMPRFPGCEELPAAVEKKQCAEQSLLEFIYRNIRFPAAACEAAIESTAVVRFVVEKDGSLSGAEVMRDIGAQCGQEALRLVNLMNNQGLRWTPGKQRGRPVRVQYIIPVKFRLDCPDTPSLAVAEEPLPGEEDDEETTEKAEEALPPAEASPSGTPLTFEPEGFRLFPNPAADQVNLRCQLEPGPVSLSVVNAVGKVFWKEEYEHSGGLFEERANLAQWPPGAYFLRIERQGAVQTYPFIRQSQ